MITQKPISLKIDKDLLDDLDTECTRTWRKRNMLINMSITYYLEIMELRRTIRNAGNEDDKKELLNKWLRERIPEAATW